MMKTPGIISPIALLLPLSVVWAQTGARLAEARELNPDVAATAIDIPEYQVEILVFRHEEFDPIDEQFRRTSAAASQGASTQADTEPGAANRDLLGNNTLISLSELTPPGSTEPPSTEEPVPIRFLKPEELELIGVSRQLERLDAYTVLGHGGWVQDGLPKGDAQPVDLSLLAIENPVGTVQVHLSRYLHLEITLDYHDRDAIVDASQRSVASESLHATRPVPSYPLFATRRIRSGELHYIDHPAFGLLVTVRPQPKPREDAKNPGKTLDSLVEPTA